MIEVKWIRCPICSSTYGSNKMERFENRVVWVTE